MKDKNASTAAEPVSYIERRRAAGLYNRHLSLMLKAPQYRRIARYAELDECSVSEEVRALLLRALDQRDREDHQYKQEDEA